MKATVEQMEMREAVLELPVGYVDRSMTWWTDYLSDPDLIRRIDEEILPDLWEEFKRAVERPVWREPVELLTRLDEIAAMTDKEWVLNRCESRKRSH